MNLQQFLNHSDVSLQSQYTLQLILWMFALFVSWINPIQSALSVGAAAVHAGMGDTTWLFIGFELVEPVAF